MSRLIIFIDAHPLTVHGQNEPGCFRVAFVQTVKQILVQYCGKVIAVCRRIEVELNAGFTESLIRLTLGLMNKLNSVVDQFLNI